jgi:hypothetical protein
VLLCAFVTDYWGQLYETTLKRVHPNMLLFHLSMKCEVESILVFTGGLLNQHLFATGFLFDMTVVSTRAQGIQF